MNTFPTNFLNVFVFNSLISVDASNGFGALILDSWYVNTVYLQEWSKDKPNEMDRSAEDASARLQICDDITRSGIFEAFGMRPVSMEDVYDELRQPEYEEIFHRIYSPSNGSESSHHPYVYTNPYTLEVFEITDPDADPENPYTIISEHTFVCLLRRIEYIDDTSSSDDYELSDYFLRERTLESGQDRIKSTADTAKVEEESMERDLAPPNDIVTVYVTEAYAREFGFHVHRYVHLDVSAFEDELMLAGRSAKAYSRPDFNIELHYLELRRHHRRASTSEHDPLLQFNSSDMLRMKLTRICTIVVTSPYFQNKFGKVRSAVNESMSNGLVSFRTEEGQRQAGRRRFHEWMMVCSVSMTSKHMEAVYISRAYNPFQVFLYLEHPLSGELYLEMLATDVPMAQDRYNLGEVEI